jgi:hypothetical protein
VGVAIFASDPQYTSLGAVLGEVLFPILTFFAFLLIMTGDRMRRGPDHQILSVSMDDVAVSISSEATHTVALD